MNIVSALLMAASRYSFTSLPLISIFSCIYQGNYLSWNTVHLNDKWNGITFQNFFILNVYTHTHLTQVLIKTVDKKHVSQ
jgi:hypothetical protein